MSTKLTKKSADIDFVPVKDGAIAKALREKGRLPPISIFVKPLEKDREPFYSTKFLSYKFSSSILVPVDTFEFKISLDEFGEMTVPVREGDIISLYANNQPISTGLVDSIDVETDEKNGTSIGVTGRDLLAQFEDQDAVSLDSSVLYAGNYTVKQVIAALAKDTRIPADPILSDCTLSPWLFATQPGESKLSALQRYCEPLNILFWASPSGRIVIGKPAMYANTLGQLVISREQRRSNVLSMRSTRSSTQIPNMMLAIWNGQETTQNRVTAEQIVTNKSLGPQRLLNLGHKVIKAVVTSTPQGSSPQDLSQVNDFTVAKASAGDGNLLKAFAKREIARANLNELQVQCQVVGHYNESGVPYMPNQVYTIKYDLDGIDEDMYLHKVEYTFDVNQSQKTNLFFCRRTAIVSDVRAVGVDDAR